MSLTNSQLSKRHRLWTLQLQVSQYTKSLTPRSCQSSFTNISQDGSLQRGDELTPISTSTGSLAISPKTPTATPGLSDARDDYFQPAIVDSPPPTQTRRPGGYGGFDEPEPVNDERHLSSSPQKGNLSLLTRMNTIARGPFETSRPSTARGEPPLLGAPTDQESNTTTRPGTSSSSASGNVAAPPKMPRKNGYEGFGPPSRDSSDMEQQIQLPQPARPESVEPPTVSMPPSLNKRSETFPSRLSSGEVPPARTPSAPGPRPLRPRRPSEAQGQDQLHPTDTTWTRRSGIRDTSRPPPPRTSLVRPPTRDGSNTLAINLADEFGVGNPFHSPSFSISSSNSGSSGSGSYRSHASSNTSPARSTTSSRMGSRRQPSDTSQIESLMSDLEGSMYKEPVVEERPIVKAAPKPMENTQRRPPPSNLRLDPNAQRGMGISPPLRSPMRSPKPRPLSPLDPAVQDPALRSRQPSVEKSRGNCKACRLPITGKSISSADGRLTGRYHKACFVCTTCMEPFSSSTFYVLTDKPYCEHHYHKLNGSLCGSCNRGIEGQYLEDESRKKYHVACFRCSDCGTVLSDGYFEVNGRVYCERDASRRLQPTPQILLREPSTRAPPRHAPSRSASRAAPPPQKPIGLPSNPAASVGSLNRPFGLPSGQRLAPGQALGRGGLGSMPRMEKRMTRMGMM